MTDKQRVELIATALGETCCALAKLGCGQGEVAGGLAAMLGAVVATVDCCPEHAQVAEDIVLEIYRANLDSHRIRYAAFDRVGLAGMFDVEGHA